MSSVSQKSERRKEQNRRAQANLRRKQQEQVEDLQQEILSLKAQIQTFTDAQVYNQRLCYGTSGQNSDFLLDNDYNRFEASAGDVPSHLVEDDLLTNDPSVSALDPFFLYFQQLPTPSYQSSNTTKSPVASELFHQVAKQSLQSAVSNVQQYHCGFDALAKNGSLLGLSPESFLSTNRTSIFYSPLQSLTSISDSIKHLPLEFHPTMAQLSYPHQPWIDCIPLPDLRSRIIFAVSHRPPFLDSLDLWHDVLSDGLSCAADPKDALLWTMSTDFMQRWQMLLRIDLSTLETMCLASNPPLQKRSLPGS